MANEAGTSAQFSQTRWSTVLAAAGQQGTAADQALERLC
jgi:hypothetical protein